MPPSTRHKQPAILFVNSIKFWGGGEQWFLQTAAALSQRGYPVCVAGRRDGEFLQRIAEASLPVLPLRLDADFSPGDFLQLRRWLRNNQPARVLCNLTRDVRLAGTAARTIPGTQVLWIMGSILLRTRWRDRFWSRCCIDRFVVPSRALAGELTSLPYIDGNRVTVLPIGMDLNEWPTVTTGDVQRCKAQLGAGPEPIIGVFARLEKRKGHASLLQAWIGVRERVPHARLWIVGTGTEEQTLREMAVPLGESVRFWGHTEQVRKIMTAVDVVTQPSLYEPFGITLIEAMACRKPIVCTSAGGMPEVVDSDCAIIVPPDDPARLADALVSLLTDHKTATAMGAAGRHRVETVFPLNRMIDGVESLLSAPPAS